MRLLIDENVPALVARVYQMRGRDIEFVRERFAAETKDNVIAEGAAQLQALIVTWNRKHFQRFVDKLAVSRAGLIAYNCPEPLGARRTEAYIDILEQCHQRFTAGKAQRFWVEVGATYLKIFD